MEDQPNIMNRPGSRLLRNAGTAVLATVAALVSMSAGSALADMRAAARPVTGSRLVVILHVAAMGPPAIRSAVTGMTSDGVVTAAEERRIYWMLDETIRRRRDVVRHGPGESEVSPGPHDVGTDRIAGSGGDQIRKDELGGLVSAELVDVGATDRNDATSFQRQQRIDMAVA